MGPELREKIIINIIIITDVMVIINHFSLFVIATKYILYNDI